MKDTVNVIGRVLEVSEDSRNNDTLRAKIRICDFNTNANGLRLNRETIEEWMYSIEMKPLVGRLRYKADDTIDFTSHNVRRIQGRDGKVEYEFDTDAFGTFKSVYITEGDGVEYIEADCVIWKRFKYATETLIRRVREGTLSTSWEIDVSKYHMEDEDGKMVKVIDNGTFIGHALLGEDVPPAYDCSKVLEVATSKNPDSIISAIIKDFLFSSSDNHQPEGKEGDVVDEKINEIDQTATQDVVDEPIAEEPVADDKIEEPVKIEPDPVEPTVVESDKDAALIKANALIAKLERQVAELTPYKEEHDKAVAERKKAEHEAAVAKLAEHAAKSGKFTPEELEDEKIKTMISNLDEVGINAIIVSRLIAEIDRKSTQVASTSVKDGMDFSFLNLNISCAPSTDDEKARLVMDKFLN